MVSGGVVAVPDDYEVLPHVEHAYRNSECRTPIFVVLDDGDPFLSICKLAKEQNCAVWTIEMTNARNEQNAMDYIDVGIKNGDWVCLFRSEDATSGALRDIANVLVTLSPEPGHYPRRSLFRLWLAVQHPIDINGNSQRIFPALLMKHALLARKAPRGTTGSKWVKSLPHEVPLLQEELQKHERRRNDGIDSDAESDNDVEDPVKKKLTGMWFCRAVDFHQDNSTPTVLLEDTIVDAVEKDDVEAFLKARALVDLESLKIKRGGMTLLQYACSIEKVNVVRAMLEAGANPNEIRASDKCPLLFMSLESEPLVRTLIEHGADYYRRYEGHALENHPTTFPHIAALIKELKAADLAAQRNVPRAYDINVQTEL